MPAIARLLALAAASATLLAAPAAADAAIVNGDFETGNLSGWQTENSTPPSGDWFAYSGTTFSPSPPPPQGSFAAITNQSGPGRHVLFQDVSLEPGATQLQLTLIAYYNSGAAIAAPASLDPTLIPNQQYRIDVLRPSAPIASVAPEDILVTVFRTLPGDPTTLGPTQKIADLSAFAGQTVRLRFAEVDNQTNLRAGTDAVSIKSNSFTVGKPRLNKKKGTAQVPVTVPGAGALTLTGNGVVKRLSAPASASVAVGRAGTVQLLVKAKGKKRGKLNRTGKAKVKVTITYTPTGLTPTSQKAKVKLKKR